MDRTLAQSVLEVLDEERRLSFRGFAEGDDPDFIFSLRVNDGRPRPRRKPKLSKRCSP